MSVQSKDETGERALFQMLALVLSDAEGVT